MSDIWKETLVVYKHTCKKTKKSYVGGVWKQSLKARVRGGGCGYKLDNQPVFYSAIQEHGWDSFDTEILAYCKDKAEVCKLEKEMIQAFNTICPNGYNIQDGGVGGKPTKEVRMKISRVKRKRAKKRRLERGVIDGETKICWSKPETCPFKGKPQPVANFGKCRDKRGNNYDGLQDKCKTCCNRRSRAYQKTPKGKVALRKAQIKKKYKKQNKTPAELEAILASDERLTQLKKELREHNELELAKSILNLC